MQTLLGFYIFNRHSSLTGSYHVFYADNGFGELIPTALPHHSIMTANQ
jgi:hypothetical protein